MSLAVEQAVRGLRPVYIGLAVEFAHGEARLKLSGQRRVYLCLGEVTLLYGLLAILLEGGTTVEILAVGDGYATGFSRRGHKVMLVIDVVYGAAVARNKAAEAPLIAQNVVEQDAVGAAGCAVQPVVSTHDGSHVGLFHHAFEGWQIVFA